MQWKQKKKSSFGQKKLFILLLRLSISGGRGINWPSAKSVLRQKSSAIFELWTSPPSTPLRIGQVPWLWLQQTLHVFATALNTEIV